MTFNSVFMKKLRIKSFYHLIYKNDFFFNFILFKNKSIHLINNNIVGIENVLCKFWQQTLKSGKIKTQMKIRRQK